MSDRLHEICAWCWREGQLTVLNGGDPIAALLAVEDGGASHGVCREHKDRLIAGLEPQKIFLAGGEI